MGPWGNGGKGIISLTGEMGRWDWDLWQTERLASHSQTAQGQPALAGSRATALSRSC